MPTLRSEHPYASRWPPSLGEEADRPRRRVSFQIPALTAPPSLWPPGETHDMSNTVTGFPASTLVRVSFHPAPSSSPTSNVATNAFLGPPFFLAIGAFRAAYSVCDVLPRPNRTARNVSPCWVLIVSRWILRISFS